jgi:hypothetical protein
VNYVAGLCLAVLVTCAAAGFVMVLISSISFWCFILGVVGFSSFAERNYPQRLTQPRPRLFRTGATWRAKSVTPLPFTRQ